MPGYDSHTSNSSGHVDLETAVTRLTEAVERHLATEATRTEYLSNTINRLVATMDSLTVAWSKVPSAMTAADQGELAATVRRELSVLLESQRSTRLPRELPGTAGGATQDLGDELATIRAAAAAAEEQSRRTGEIASALSEIATSQSDLLASIDQRVASPGFTPAGSEEVAAIQGVVSKVAEDSARLKGAVGTLLQESQKQGKALTESAVRQQQLVKAVIGLRDATTGASPQTKAVAAAVEVASADIRRLSGSIKDLQQNVSEEVKRQVRHAVSRSTLAVVASTIAALAAIAVILMPYIRQWLP